MPMPMEIPHIQRPLSVIPLLDNMDAGDTNCCGGNTCTAIRNRWLCVIPYWQISLIYRMYFVQCMRRDLTDDIMIQRNEEFCWLLNSGVIEFIFQRTMLFPDCFPY